MANAIHTPFDFSDPVKAGRRRFWKQILPLASIDYKGQKIAFDREFHTDLAESFRKDAYDQVPVVFADADNQHNMDPKNYGGDVLDIQPRTDGLYALIEADKDAAKAIQRNPKLGVSARIVQDLAKADGRHFKRALQHVLLTMNPRVTNMGPWQAVDLSEDAEIEVVDLAAETYEEGSPMGKSTATTRKPTQIDLSNLTDDEFQTLLDLSAASLERMRQGEDDEEDDDEDKSDPVLPEDVEEEAEDPEVPPSTKKKKKVVVEASDEDEPDEDEDDEDDEEDEDKTDLSDAAVVKRQQDLTSVRQMQIDLAEEKWQGQRRTYVEHGVPPFLLDLAEPVLSLPEPVTIDLSDDETVDASATIRKMLDGVKGLIDLTPEVGHQMDLTEANEEDDQFLKAWDEQYG